LSQLSADPLLQALDSARKASLVIITDDTLFLARVSYIQFRGTTVPVVRVSSAYGRREMMSRLPTASIWLGHSDINYVKIQAGMAVNG